MPGQNIPNTSDNTKLPVIIAVHRAEHQLTEQSYKPIFIIECEDASIPAPTFFNMAQKDYIGQPCVMIFLSEFDFLTSANSAQVIVKRAFKSKYFGGMYSDSLVLAHTPIPQVMPAFSRHTYNLIPVNNPMFIHGQALTEWDEDLSVAYFFDMFKKLGKSTLLAHIPEPLISSIYHPIDQEELQKVKNKYEQ